MSTAAVQDDRVVQAALKEAAVWREMANKWHGIFPAVYALHEAVLTAISNNDRQAAIAATSELFVFLNDLHEVLVKPPFGNPVAVAELRKTVEQLLKIKELAERSVDRQVTDTQRQIAEAIELQRIEFEDRRTALTGEHQQALQAQAGKFEQQLSRLQSELAQLQSARALAEEAQAHAEGKLHEALAANEAFLANQATRQPVSTGLVNAQQVADQMQSMVADLGRLQAAFSQHISGLTGGPGPTPPNVSPAVPEHFQLTLTRWEAWQVSTNQALRKIGLRIEDLESQLEAAQAEAALNPEEAGTAEAIEQRLREANELKTDLLAKQSKGSATLRQLREFWAATQLVGKGLPSDLLQDPETVPDVEQIFEENEEEPAELGEEGTEGNKLEILQKIAEKHHIASKTLFMITLYDILKSRGQKHKRGQMPVLGAALRAGLLAPFDCEKFPDFFKDWKPGDDKTISDRYLKFCGKIGRLWIFRRTDTPLPWNPKAIFSEAEIQLFLDEISKPTGSQ